MSGTRLLALLTSDPSGPVLRHRWLPYRQALEAADVFLEVVEWPKHLRGRRHALHRAETADGVLVSSRLLRPADTRKIARRTPHLGFDFDDALVFRDSARGATRSRTRSRRFAALLAAADQVFAGNAHLAELALSEGKEADVLPTVVEVSEGKGISEPATGPLVVGWIGSRPTLPHLASIGGALVSLASRGYEMTVRVVADAAPNLPSEVPVEWIPWTPEGWLEALGGIHVGVAPLVDDAFSRGKCGLKVLQTMDVGRPVVASPVGVQKEQVVHGETGFFAASTTEFEARLAELFDDAPLRARMGRAARATVKAGWSAGAWAPRVVTAVKRWLGT